MPDRRESPVKSSGAPVEGERIAKYLASAGLASRREIERFILDGRVVVDGVKLESPAFKVTGQERILVDGKPVARPSVSRLWRYHKPAGLVTTNQDPDGRPTIFDMLPGELPRVLTIGRLDLNTEGLLLLTNDGGLARALELPSTGLERTYRARAYGRITQPDLDRLRDGVVVDGVEYRSIRARLERSVGANCWIELVLTEGKNREVRRALESLGLKVNRLIRVSYGPFELADLAPGVVAEVSPADLLAEVGEMIAPERRPDPSRPVRARASSNAPKKSGEPRGSRDDRPRGPPERSPRRPRRDR